jgi:hypothetical protein
MEPEIEVELKAIQLVKRKDERKPVHLTNIPPAFDVIGTGTDAAVVRHEQQPSVVYKIYADEVVDKCAIEYEVYQRLVACDSFATCYTKGDRYLQLSYEPGPTLYQCLEQGIDIFPNVISQVEEAREFVKQQGLNPRDIHLKNVILQKDRIKLIDVSEYMRSGNDYRWEHLVEGYQLFYPLIRGKKIPVSLMERVKRWYDQEQDSNKFFTKLRSFVKEAKNEN